MRKDNQHSMVLHLHKMVMERRLHKGVMDHHLHKGDMVHHHPMEDMVHHRLIQDMAMVRVELIVICIVKVPVYFFYYLFGSFHLSFMLLSVFM